MTLLEFCQYTPVSKVYALEATYHPFDSHVYNCKYIYALLRKTKLSDDRSFS
jgi:hypothetical protein